MDKNDRVVLRPGKEKSLRQQHPWIFSGAIATGGKGRAGELLPVYSSQGELLGTGYFNTRSSIIGRMVSFDARSPYEVVQENVRKAIALRRQVLSADITGYRLINGEGDFLPGLIVDLYGTVAVLQIGTLGMERLRPLLIDFLKQELPLTAIYEKSTLASRAEEGLEEESGWLFGLPTAQIEMKEYGLRYWVEPEFGQKTGFFLDQREMRQLIQKHAHGRSVLNCFSYTGAFSIAALAGGAQQALSVDSSAKALALASAHAQLNGFAKRHQVEEADVFHYLRHAPISQNLIILDPPAFAKRRTDVVQACRGYKDINRLAMAKAPAGTLLLTCSCSHFVDDLLFQKVVFQASQEAKRKVRILDRHHLALDHPVNICHPEGHYLKSLFLYLE